MTIHVFGNPLVPGDNAVFPLVDRLRTDFPGIDFRVTDPNEDFPPAGERCPVILDTVQGLHEVRLLEYDNLAAIDKSPVSPHDYDLLLHLLLLKKLDKIDAVTIIGLPFSVHAVDYSKVKSIISSLPSGSGKHRTCRDQTRG